MNRRKRLLASISAFVLTVCFLLAMGGALRVEYATHRTLHGEGASFRATAVLDAADRTADTALRVLPARLSLAVNLGRRAVDTVAGWIAF